MKEMLRHIAKKLKASPRGLSGLMGLIGLMCVIGCTNDSEEDTTTERKTVTVMPYFASFLEINEMPTRALPDGYKTYAELYPASTSAYSSIGLILTPYQNSVSNKSIRYKNNKWEGALDITAGQTYYIYGFMPSELADRAIVTSPDGTDAGFAQGATLTINNLSTLTPADVCVVVGVKEGDGTDIKNIGIHLGEFEYRGGAENYVYLLLKHLYAGLHFKAHIDTEYAKLRTIKVKEMKLKSVDDIHEFIDLSVTLTANETNTDPTSNITYTDVGTETVKPEVTLFPYAGSEAEYELPTETTSDFLSCFAPQKCKKFELYTRYDVYDKKGNLIRKDSEAYNKIDATGFYGIDNLQPGDIYTIDLKVQPTYLYVLSDPDIDNPTFVAN